MPLTVGALSDKGRVRANNEDSFVADEELGLFIVADGMGGHNAGEVASRMAAELVTGAIRSLRERDADPERTRVTFGPSDPSLPDEENRLAGGIKLANRAINEASAGSPERRGMGTTIVAARIAGDMYTLAWVGDSRIYLMRHGLLQQVSVDHSLVQEQVCRGLISEDQADKSEFKNILTRALGPDPEVEVDSASLGAFDNDYLVLCSDGLTRMVPDDVIADTIRSKTDPADICSALVAAANDAGGRDNVTVIVVHYRQDRLWTKLFNRKR